MATLRNLSSDPEYASLASSITSTARDETIDFYPSPGNWGDALINEGSRQLFNDFGVRFRERDRASLECPATDRSPTLAVLGGGGGWNLNWRSSLPFAIKLSEKYESVIVLPSSYDFGFIGNALPAEVKLFTRARLQTGVKAEFCHDLALYCQTQVETTKKLPYPLVALRRDKERHRSAISPDRNWDISLLGTADHDSASFFGLVNRFESVITDRLHVGIAAAMLGCKVRLLEGNYGKNHGVFDASLRENFTNVQFCNWNELRHMDFVGRQPIGISGYPATRDETDD